MVAHAFNLIAWEVEAGGLALQEHPQPHSKFEPSLGEKRKDLGATKQVLS